MLNVIPRRARMAFKWAPLWLRAVAFVLGGFCVFVCIHIYTTFDRESRIAAEIAEYGGASREYCGPTFFPPSIQSRLTILHRIVIASLDAKLGESEIKPSVVADIATLTRLRELELLNIPTLTDVDMQPLGRLPLLEVLELEGSHVGDAGVAHLALSTNLRILGLRKTRITDAGLRHLGGMTNLEQLSICDTATTDHGIAQLGRLRKIYFLDVANTRLTDEGLKVIAELTNLQILRIDNTEITDTGVALLRPLLHLNSLVLNETQISDASFTYLQSLTDLRFLYVNGTNITDAGVRQLSSLQKLFRLEASAVRSSEEFLDWLGSLPSLRIVSLSDGEFSRRNSTDRLKVSE